MDSGSAAFDDPFLFWEDPFMLDQLANAKLYPIEYKRFRGISNNDEWILKGLLISFFVLGHVARRRRNTCVPSEFDSINRYRRNSLS